MEKEIKYFSERPPFINRIAEKRYFLQYFNGAPTNILFVYWPKSTWKTALINKVINEDLDKEKFAVSYLNMRDRLIINFKDFQNVFFPKDLKWKAKEIVSWVKINLGFFGWSVEDENLMSEDIFTLMYKKLVKANKNWIKPVIILDEFQYLKSLYIDDAKEVKLIEELFKFFISITKQHNLAHVVCLTSDSYFLEELYNDTKLSNTSRFYIMEHLSKKDIFYWLEDLEKIDKKIVNKIWKNLWWSVWEIWQVLTSYKNTWDFKETLDDLLQTKYSLVFMLYDEDFWKLTNIERKEFVKVIKRIVNKWYCLKSEEKVSFELIKKLVDNDTWFYDIKTLKITANSKSLQVAFKKLLKELK